MMTTRNMTHLRRAKSFSDFELDRLWDLLEAAGKEVDSLLLRKKLEELREKLPDTDTPDPRLKSKKRAKDDLDIALSEPFSLITADVTLVIDD